MFSLPGIRIPEFRILIFLVILRTVTVFAGNEPRTQEPWAVSDSEWKATFADALGETGKSSPIAKSLLYVYGMQLEKRSLEILQKHEKALQSALDWGEKPPSFPPQEALEVRSTAVRGNLLLWYALALKDNPASSDRKAWEGARQKNLQTRQRLMLRYGASAIHASWRNFISAVNALGLPRAGLDSEL